MRDKKEQQGYTLRARTSIPNGEIDPFGAQLDCFDFEINT